MGLAFSGGGGPERVRNKKRFVAVALAAGVGHKLLKQTTNRGS